MTWGILMGRLGGNEANELRWIKLMEVFTPEEKRICQLLMEGYTKVEVAEMLDLTPRSLSRRLKKIGEKVRK